MLHSSVQKIPVIEVDDFFADLVAPPPPAPVLADNIAANELNDYLANKVK